MLPPSACDSKMLALAPRPAFMGDTAQVMNLRRLREPPYHEPSAKGQSDGSREVVAHVFAHRRRDGVEALGIAAKHDGAIDLLITKGSCHA